MSNAVELNYQIHIFIANGRHARVNHSIGNLLDKILADALRIAILALIVAGKIIPSIPGKRFDQRNSKRKFLLNITSP